MNNINLIKSVLEKLNESGCKEALELAKVKSLGNCHANGLYSIVIDGEDGNLTRVFIATEDIEPFDIAMHSHRYNLQIGVVRGKVTHHTAEYSTSFFDSAVELPLHRYTASDRSFVYQGQHRVMLKSFDLPVGSELELFDHELHSVSCKKGAMWIVKELGYSEDGSEILGVPFDVDGLYTSVNSSTVEMLFGRFCANLSKFSFM